MLPEPEGRADEAVESLIPVLHDGGVGSGDSPTAPASSRFSETFCLKKSKVEKNIGRYWVLIDLVCADK